MNKTTNEKAPILYVWNWNYTLKPSDEIPHDEIIQGDLIKEVGSRSNEWEDYFCLGSNARLWEEVVHIQNFYKRYVGHNLLAYQNITSQREVTRADDYKFMAEVGEIKIEALVEYHKSEFYYSALNTRHKQVSAGVIKAFRLLNPEIIGILINRKVFGQ